MIRVTDQIIQFFDNDIDTHRFPKTKSLKTKQEINDNHLQTWIEKPQHGNLIQTCKDTNQANENARHLWLPNSKVNICQTQ